MKLKHTFQPFVILTIILTLCIFLAACTLEAGEGTAMRPEESRKGVSEAGTKGEVTVPAKGDSLFISDTDREAFMLNDADKLIRFYSCHALVYGLADGLSVEEATQDSPGDCIVYENTSGSVRSRRVFTETQLADTLPMPLSNLPDEIAVSCVFEAEALLQENLTDASDLKINGTFVFFEEYDNDAHTVIIYYQTNVGDYILFKPALREDSMYLLPAQAFKEPCQSYVTEVRRQNQEGDYQYGFSYASLTQFGDFTPYTICA